jgi:hypothetical protein
MCVTLGSQPLTTFVLTMVCIDALRRLLVAQTIPIEEDAHLVLESGTARIEHRPSASRNSNALRLVDPPA